MQKIANQINIKCNTHKRCYKMVQKLTHQVSVISAVININFESLSQAHSIMNGQYTANTMQLSIAGCNSANK